MRVIVCGKGGSGKSTVSAQTAVSLNKSGYNVLLIDADESNTCLHRLIGANPPQILMDSFGGKKGFKEKTNSAFPEQNEIFSQGMTINEISQECISDIDGIKLLSIGKINEPDEGCACPMGRLSKMVLSKLSIGENDVVIIDTAAGLEHFGRGLESQCDLILCVIDPTCESFILSEKMADLAEKTNTEIYFILNKVSADIIETMEENSDPSKVITHIYNEKSIFEAGLYGETISVTIPEMKAIADFIEAKKNLLKQ